MSLSSTRSSSRSRHAFGRGLVLLALVACRGAEGPEDAKGGGAEDPTGPNLLLVTLDTTRADRLGAYGHGAAETPRLDALAAKGIRFERAYAHAPLTLPTHASLFTGVFPPEHGIHDNGRLALGPELTTLAEIFQAKGFRTGAFVSAIALDGSFGLDRGFDVYDDDLGEARAPGQRVLDRPATQVVDATLAWLAEDTGPFFAWAHFYDPHADYAPPSDFALDDPYDGEIAYVDAQLGRLLGWLEAQGLTRNTLIVVVADHGESLGEKGEHTHASLIYEGTQHIPWIMVLPERIPAGAIARDLVQQVDLLPTLMELYDWSSPDQVSGQSLGPLLRGEALDARPVYIESEYCALNFGWSSLRGLLHDKWKYIEAPSPELYDLSIDPDESRNLAASEPQVLKDLARRLDELTNSMRSYAAADVELGAGMSEGLSDLGYVQGSTESGEAASGSTINPIERIEYLELYHLAVGFANHGEFAAMIEPLERVVTACPESAGFRSLLGDAYRRLQRFDEAREQLDEALELVPGYDPAHFYLGALHETQGAVDDALASYRENVRLRPEYVPARQAIARLLAGKGDIAGAVAQYEEIVELDPNNAQHWIARAELEGRRSGSQARRSALERALDLAPDDLMTRDYCAWVLATSGDEQVRDAKLATTIASELVRRTSGRVARFLDTLAAAQASNGDFDAAVATAEKALAVAEGVDPPEFIQGVREHLASYRAQRPLREN